MNPLRICVACSELYPFSKAGGLGDVSAALGRYLGAAGHDVRIFSPLYATIDWNRYPMMPVDFAQDVPVDLHGRQVVFSLYTSRLPGTDVWAYFIHCPQMYDRSGIYTSDNDEYVRFIVLCRAVFLACQRMGWSPHVIHCNDWQTALMPVLKGTVFGWDGLFRPARTVLTIHNIGYQGIFPEWARGDVLPPEHQWLLDQGDLRAGRINFLKTGIRYADKLTAVSPTYAREIQSETFGEGLEVMLRERRSDLLGILNGVDYSEWSPEQDPYIEHSFSSRAPVRGKTLNKKDLLHSLGLPYLERTPVIGIISRMVEQKGFDILFEPLPRLLEKRDFQLVVAGSGSSRYEDFFSWLQSRFPDKVSFYRGYNNQLAHMIEAASDMFLMPSRYEPCGLNQMYSLRYGTIPIVRKTGGLADTVQLFNPATGEGTGIVFDHFNFEGVNWALNFALDLYPQRKLWLKLMRNAMRQDFSWETQIQHYIRLYSEMSGQL